jgi:hypothetical protein
MSRLCQAVVPHREGRLATMTSRFAEPSENAHVWPAADGESDVGGAQVGST